MHRVTIPLLNANDDEVLILEVNVKEGDQIKQGETICVVETTKATSDIEAPTSGYVRQLSLNTGQYVQVGAVACVITESLDESVPEESLPGGTAPNGNQADTRVEATKKAQELAAQLGINLADLQHDGILTAKDVERLAKKDGHGSGLDAEWPAVDAAKIVVYGAGGHAGAVVDLIRASRRDLEIVGVIDDAQNGAQEVMGIPVIGGSEKLPQLVAQGIGHAGLGIGSVHDNPARIGHFDKLCAANLNLPSLIHPQSSVEQSVRMGGGNQIFAGAVIGSNVQIGSNAIINSGSVISHDCRVGSHAHITPGAILAGGVTVGKATLIGMGVTIYLGVTIGSNVVIANGVHILHDVPDGTIVRASH